MSSVRNVSVHETARAAAVSEAPGKRRLASSATSSQQGGTPARADSIVPDGKPSQKPQQKPKRKNTGSTHRRSRSGRNSFQRSGKFASNRGVFSAIDLGTNNCRLLIARPTRSGFRVVDAFSRIVRLGEGLADSGALSQDAMDRTVEALRICATKVERRGVTCMRHVATEACRIASNSDAFMERIKAETGLNIEVISAAEEARLAVLGCQSLISPSNRNALVFDIGGGSTELIWVSVRPGAPVEIVGWMSIPWGVVNLTETYCSDGYDHSPANYQAMVAEIRKHLDPFEAEYQLSNVIHKKKVQLLGTSGTVTTLASLHMGLKSYIRDQVDGAWMNSPDMLALSQQIAAMSYEERAAQPCIGPDRAKLVVAGCAILEAILQVWTIRSLRVADRGIREGILRGLMETGRPVIHKGEGKPHV